MSLFNLWKRHKILIIAAAVLLVVLLLYFWVTSLGQSSKPAIPSSLIPSPTLMTGTQNSPSEDSQTRVASISPNAPLFSTYKSSDYSISLPSGWRTEALSISGGSLTRISPDALPSGIYYPYYSIEVDSNISTPLSQREFLYKAMNFRISTITIDGANADKVSGSLPTHLVSGQKVNTPLQTTTVFLQKGNKQYLLKYEYVDSQADPIMENYFMSLFQSMKLN